MRPLWSEFPSDATLFDMDDQWMVGSALIVKPVTTVGVTSVSILLPGAEPWYDIVTSEKYRPGRSVVPAPLNKIPVFQRGGSIVPRQMRPRRSSDLMVNDPYTLVVALDNNQNAAGTIFLDDGITYNFERKNDFSYVSVQYKGGVLSSAVASGVPKAVANKVERIVILGLPLEPKSITASEAGTKTPLTFQYDSSLQRLTIRKPDLAVAGAWTVVLS